MVIRSGCENMIGKHHTLRKVAVMDYESHLTRDHDPVTLELALLSLLNFILDCTLHSYYPSKYAHRHTDKLTNASHHHPQEELSQPSHR